MGSDEGLASRDVIKYSPPLGTIGTLIWRVTDKLYFDYLGDYLTEVNETIFRAKSRDNKSILIMNPIETIERYLDGAEENETDLLGQLKNVPYILDSYRVPSDLSYLAIINTGSRVLNLALRNEVEIVSSTEVRYTGSSGARYIIRSDNITLYCRQIRSDDDRHFEDLPIIPNNIELTVGG